MKFGNTKKPIEINEALPRVFEALKSKGYGIEPGLNDEEIDAVEKAFHASLPADFKTFLQAGFVVNAPPPKNPRTIMNDYFPDWRHPEKEADRARDFIERTFTFDIEKNDYWNSQFGEKPDDLAQAISQALTVVKSWPPLFPIHAHHFIPSDPQESGNPVLSIWQATDTVFVGANLLEYLDSDFGLGLHTGSSKPATVPFWGEAFGLS